MAVPIPQALAAINTLLSIGNGASPEVYNVIANVGDLTGPGIMADVVDVTSHSTGVPWRQKITTLRDGGDISLPLFFIPWSPGSGGVPNTPYGHDEATGLLGQLVNAVPGTPPSQFSLEFPDGLGTTYFFNGYVSKFNIKAPVAGVLTADVTITITGRPTFST